MFCRSEKRAEKVFATIAPRKGLPFKSARSIARVIVSLAVFTLLAVAFVPATGSAQNAPPAQAAKGVQILLLGTNEGPPIHVDRSEPSSLLIVDGREYLIDCGIGTIRRMARAGIESDTIRTIFFTHLHPDHALGLADLMANDFFTLGIAHSEPTINIYGPPETSELVKAALDYVRIPYDIFQAEGLPWTVQNAHFVAHDFSENGLVYQDDKIRVTAAENTHYAMIPAKYHARMKSYSYRFQTPYGVIVFTGDTGPSDAVARLAKGADVLVTEASVGHIQETVQAIKAAGERNHWTAQQTRDMAGHFQFGHLDEKEIGELATKAQVKSVLLHHFDPQDPAAYVAGVKQYYSGPVFAGADLERYCLNNQTLEPCH